MANEKINEFTNLYEIVKTGSNFSEGHLGDDDFSFINSKIFHPENMLPWSSPLFYTTFFSIDFVVDAHGKIIAENIPINIEPETLYINKPGEIQQLTWEKINEAYSLCFTENFLSKYAGISIYKTFPFLLFENNLSLRMSTELQQELKKIILLINDELKKKSPVQKKICANLLTRLLLKIKKEFWEDYRIYTQHSREKPDIVKDFKQNLEYHYNQLEKGTATQVMHLKDYAKMQGLHVNYLSSILKEKTGKTGGQLIAQKTLSTAKKLIEDSRLSIKEIAYKLGFSYISYFSLFFKKHTGCSPADYRKKDL